MGFVPQFKTGQCVRLKPSSPICGHGGIAPDTLGEVLCLYQSAGVGMAAPGKVDVKFSGDVVLWGVPTTEFEPVADAARQDPGAGTAGAARVRVVPAPDIKPT